jgi:hypothetical protein
MALSELPEHMPKGYHKLFAGWEMFQSELIELPDKRPIYLLSGRFQLQGQTLAMQQYFIPGRDNGGIFVDLSLPSQRLSPMGRALQSLCFKFGGAFAPKLKVIPVKAGAQKRQKRAWQESNLRHPGFGGRCSIH